MADVRLSPGPVASAAASSGFRASRAEPVDSLDDFPTQPYALRALLDRIQAMGQDLRRASAWEPCANRGHLVRVLCERFGAVLASDIADYGAGFVQRNFLSGRVQEGSVDWIITNPPFNVCESVIARALDVAHVGVAMFLRTNVLAGEERYRSIFDRRPPSMVLQFAERIPIHRGVLRDPREPYLNPRTGSYATPTTQADYLWLVWLKARRASVPELHWVAPGAKALIRPGDYPDDPCGVAHIERREVLIDG
ncbi:hypothetical protein [Maritimibacter sp. DP1N21-5]|uniref:hypothetical protein n=1 Tax=Maritimibacter sp. DP1N21-5 TaxID=2836867 RepID=UPI001C4645B9|nr:hypothetical protein [Maritimibacter sp. DP1N21-5]MBV7408188.1 hypothetical protein [Maritimibacter sp. DP1N21-5]